MERRAARSRSDSGSPSDIFFGSWRKPGFCFQLGRLRLLSVPLASGEKRQIPGRRLNLLRQKGTRMLDRLKSALSGSRATEAPKDPPQSATVQRLNELVRER